MDESVLVRIFEHNNWANLKLIEACADLTDAQLDAEPQTAVKGSIRRMLVHMINSQEDYLSQLLGIEIRFLWESPPDFAELRAKAAETGEGLIELARNESTQPWSTPFVKDGYSVEPWLLMVQALSHTAEHREQISSMMNAVGVKPPRIDGWGFGAGAGALIQIAAEE